MWNLYNQVLRVCYTTNTNANWTYGTAGYRESNNGTGAVKAEFVVGILGYTIEIDGSQNAIATTSGARGAIGITSTTVQSGKTWFSQSTAAQPYVVQHSLNAPIGYSYATMLEYVDGGTATYNGLVGGGKYDVHIYN